MEAYGRSDIGLVRSSNQDDFYFEVVSEGCAWAVVCDGMGGANGGNVASSTAVAYIKERFSEEFSLELSAEEVEKTMTEILIDANRVVYEKAQSTPELSGMGTTCEFVLIRNKQINVIHVGDSRTYSIRGGKLKQITEDHSVVQEMVRRGELTPEQAENHPNKNYITRALGIAPEIVIDFIQFDFAYGDVLLICTDGLSNCVSGIDIIKTVHEKRGESLVDALIERANAGGGKDNITAVVLY